MTSRVKYSRVVLIVSLVQSLKAAPFLSNSNRYIYNIRRGLQHFKANTAENSITIMWIPAHVGILGNEIADKAAKKATSQTTPQRSQVPYSDCLQAINQKIQSISEEKWKAQANTSGKYFQHFHRKANTPWFHNKKISRHGCLDKQSESRTSQPCLLIGQSWPGPGRLLRVRPSKTRSRPHPLVMPQILRKQRPNVLSPRKAKH